MGRSVLLGTLVTRCLQRGNKPVGDDAQIETPEVKSIISEYYGDMHALIVEKGAWYFTAEDTITATGAASYALPAAHLSTIGVDLVLSGTTGPRRPVCGPIAMQERSRLVGLTGPADYYGFEGANLALYPVPSSGTYRHLYVPQPTDLSTSADSTSVDLINIYGEKFIVWGVASVLLHRGESNQQRALTEHEKALGQLEYWASLRAVTQPSYRVNEDIADYPYRYRYRDGGDYIR